MNMMDLATTLFGRSRAEENIVSTDATTRTYVGTATSDSSDGSVYVALSEDVTMPDDYDGEHGVGVEMPTTVGVSEGDEVLVTVFGGGTMKAPVVTGNPGWGDAVQEQAANAESIAEQAEAVASATGQHFWSDTDGAHVTEVTQETWSDSTSPNYHSGANVLINALGQLFRDGLNNILAIVSGTDPGIAIYDGDGNAADNILALLTKSLIRLGGRFAASGRSTAKVQFFEDDSALTDLTAEHYIDTTTEPQVSHDLALSSTITDDELPDGTSRTVTGNVEVWEQIYNDGSTYSDEVTASLNGATTNRQYNVSMGVSAVESSGSAAQRIAFIVADTLRLTHGTGKQASVTTIPMEQAIDELTESSGTGTYASPFSAYGGSNGNLPRWWRSGNVVHFSGIATVTSQQADATRTLFTLPAGFRPNDRNRYLGRMQGSGMNSWELSVETSGAVKLQRYGTTSGIALPSGVWLPYAGTFII